MALNDFLHPDRIIFSLHSKSKWDIVGELISPLSGTGLVIDKKAALRSLREREELCSTGLEGGIAAPHAKTDTVKEPVISLGLHREGADFDAIDGNPSYIFFLVLTPQENTQTHLDILTEIGKIAAVEDICGKLLTAENAEEVVALLNEI